MFIGLLLFCLGCSADPEQPRVLVLGLDGLDPSQRPHALQALAHAQFLEGNHVAALATLRDALRYEPEDPALRAAYGGGETSRRRRRDKPVLEPTRRG